MTMDAAIPQADAHRIRHNDLGITMLPE